MKFFKNRGVALVLCLLIVLGSTLLNTHMKFGGMCRELTDAFYGEGGIAPDLEIIQDEAKVLAAIGQANGLDVSALRTATDNMQGMLSQRSVGAAELYRYYDALDRCPQGVGVAPDVEVSLAGDSVPLEPDPQSDNQLAAAIEILQRQIQD